MPERLVDFRENIVQNRRPDIYSAFAGKPSKKLPLLVCPWCGRLLSRAVWCRSSSPVFTGKHPLLRKIASLSKITQWWYHHLNVGLF